MSKKTTTLKSLKGLVTKSKNAGNETLAAAHQCRHDEMKRTGELLTVAQALDVTSGCVITKQQRYQLWQDRHGDDDGETVFGACSMCMSPESVNVITSRIIEWMPKAEMDFVCVVCVAMDNFPKAFRIRRFCAYDDKRLEIWMNYNGLRAQAICLCCESTNMHVMSCDWHVGHVQARVKGGNCDVKNLVPICAGCNLAMGSTTMTEYRRDTLKLNVSGDGAITLAKADIVNAKLLRKLLV
jgi:hypothetical protein